MPYLAVIGTAFALTFLAELPDKSMFASLVLATRYQPAWVWAGAAAAFVVQMVIAVTAGQLLTLLPHRLVLAVTAGLFLAGSAYLWAASFRGPAIRTAPTPLVRGVAPVVPAGGRDEFRGRVPGRVGRHHPAQHGEPGRQV